MKERWFERGPSLRRIEVWLGLALTLALIALDVKFYCAAGGLYRDEAVSANLASMASIGQIWRNIIFDSFPILWGALLHAWTQYGPGSADASIRLLTLLISLSALIACWWSARLAHVNVPWALLIVLALNPTMIVYGGGVRGYGLGVVTELAMLGALCWFAQRPTWRRAVLATIAAVACVQTIYANSFMLGAAGIAWAIVFWRRRDRKAFGLLTAIVGVAAITVLPYVRTFSQWQNAVDTVGTDFGLMFWLRWFRTALEKSGPTMLYVWSALGVAVLVASCRYLIVRKPALPGPDADLLLWSAAAMIGAALLHFGFMLMTRLATCHYHYLCFIALTAFAMDVTMEIMIGSKRNARLGRIVAALVLVGVIWDRSSEEANVQMTNIDLVAAAIEQHAAPDDLVVVWPWYLTCSFYRYYRGPAPWIGLPDLEDKRFQHPLYFRRKMLEEDAIAGEIERITTTLKSGHRIWLVGGLHFSRERPQRLPTTPAEMSAIDPRFWNHFVYSNFWSMEVGYLVQTHCREIEYVSLPAPEERSRIEENVPLLRAGGWN